jgi:ABC-type transport system involved in cytochrome c biogenesis permease subunit
VINRFTEFMGLDAARIVAGLGLIGMGIATVMGVAAMREERGMQVGAMAGGVLLALWGAVILYYVANDDFATDLLGWTAVIVGVGLCAFALYRRRSEATVSS